MERAGGTTEPSIATVEQFLRERGCPDREAVGYDPLDLNSTRFASGEWRLPFADSPFGELDEVRLPNPQKLDRDGMVAFLASMGWIRDLPDDDRMPLLAGVRSLLDAAEYRLLWETRAYSTRLES